MQYTRQTVGMVAAVDDGDNDDNNNNEAHFCCSDSTAFCFTIRLFVTTVWSNGHSYNFICQFFPNPSGSLIHAGQPNDLVTSVDNCGCWKRHQLAESCW